MLVDTESGTPSSKSLVMNIKDARAITRVKKGGGWFCGTTNLVPRVRAHVQSVGSKCLASLVLTKRNAASGN